MLPSVLGKPARPFHPGRDPFLRHWKGRPRGASVRRDRRPGFGGWGEGGNSRGGLSNIDLPAQSFTRSSVQRHVPLTTRFARTQHSPGEWKGNRPKGGNAEGSFAGTRRSQPKPGGGGGHSPGNAPPLTTATTTAATTTTITTTTNRHLEKCPWRTGNWFIGSWSRNYPSPPFCFTSPCHLICILSLEIRYVVASFTTI